MKITDVTTAKELSILQGPVGTMLKNEKRNARSGWAKRDPKMFKDSKKVKRIMSRESKRRNR